MKYDYKTTKKGYEIISKVNTCLNVNIKENKDNFEVTLGVLRTEITPSFKGPSKTGIVSNKFEAIALGIEWQKWNDKRNKNSAQWKKKKKRGGRT